MGFRSFVILAAMRTGSNFLEESLNGVPGITCHGELFNPAFVGYPKGDAPFWRYARGPRP
jgi:LPS sulfotransferase NodH